MQKKKKKKKNDLSDSPHSSRLNHRPSDQRWLVKFTTNRYNWIDKLVFHSISTEFFILQTELCDEQKWQTSESQMERDHESCTTFNYQPGRRWLFLPWILKQYTCNHQRGLVFRFLLLQFPCRCTDYPVGGEVNHVEPRQDWCRAVKLPTLARKTRRKKNDVSERLTADWARLN